MSQNRVSPPRSYDLALQNFRLQAGLTPQEINELEMTTLEDLQKALATMQTKQQHTGQKTDVLEALTAVLRCNGAIQHSDQHLCQYFKPCCVRLGRYISTST
jgi:hypothetical protein